MLSRLSQIKQSISNELDQAVGKTQKPLSNDPVAVIERNAELLQTDTPSANELAFMAGDETTDDVQIDASASENEQAQTGEQPENTEGTLNDSAANELLPEAVQVKLKKFAKYEEKYPMLLKAFRTEKKRAELVRLYEQVLAEHTPVDSIAKPQEIVDYLDSLSNKNTLLKQELERVSDSLARLRKRNNETLAAHDMALKEVSRLEAAQGNPEELTNAQAKIEELEKQLGEQRELKEALEQRVEELEEKLSEAEKKCALATEELSSLKQELTEATGVKEHLSKELADLKEVCLQHEEQLKNARQTALESDPQSEPTSETEVTSTTMPESAATETQSKSSAKRKKKRAKQAQKAQAESTLHATPASLPKESMAEPEHEPAEPKLKPEDLKIDNTRIEALEQTIAELKSKISFYETKLSESETQIAEAERRLAEQTELCKSLEKQAAGLKADLTSAFQRQGDAEARVKELEVQAIKHGEDAVQIEKLRKQIAQLEKFEAQAAKQSRQLEDQTKRIDQLNTELQSLHNAQQQCNRAERALALNKQTLAALEAEKLEAKQRVAHLETKLENTSEEARGSRQAHEIAIRQLEETRARLSETNTSTEMLQEALEEAERLAHERLQELMQLRSSARNKASEESGALSEAQKLVASLSAERDQLEVENRGMGRRLLRDGEQLRSQIQQLQQELDLVKQERDKLRQETMSLQTEAIDAKIRNRNDVEAQDGADHEIQALTQQLEASKAELQEQQRSATVLRRLGDDLQQRLDRQLKIQTERSAELDMLKRENAALKHARARSRSISSTTPEPQSESSHVDQQIYTKNVLLGFLEHRDQRQRLLPVLAALLRLDSNDEKRIFSALS